MEEVINTIITALIAPVVLGGVAILWKYLDKKNQLKLKELEKKITCQNSQVKKDIGIIYNILSVLLANTKAHRAYIIQPYPLEHSQFVTVEYEVTDMGVMPIKTTFHKVPVSNIPVFFGEISTKDFLFYKDITQMKGIRSRANYAYIGTRSLIVKHLSDDKNDYVGSLCLDYLDECEITPDFARVEMQQAADKIQFIIPPVDK